FLGGFLGGFTALSTGRRLGAILHVHVSCGHGPVAGDGLRIGYFALEDHRELIGERVFRVHVEALVVFALPGLRDLIDFGIEVIVFLVLVLFHTGAISVNEISDEVVEVILVEGLLRGLADRAANVIFFFQILGRDAGRKCQWRLCIVAIV